VAWVRIPTLSSSVDTTFYVYYGDPTISSSQENKTGVWDTNYVGVYHQHETSSTVFDSTIYGNNGTPLGGMNQNAGGYIDGGDQFDGVNDRIDLGDTPSLQLSSAMSICAWVDPTANGGIREIVRKGVNGNYILRLQSDNKVRLYLYIGGWHYATSDTTTSAAGGWYYVCGTYNGSSMRVYVNGTASGAAKSQTGAINTAGGWPALIGVLDNGGSLSRQFPGFIDEVRISNAARSAEWIQTSHINQSSPATFYSVGTEEVTGGGSGTVDYYLGAIADYEGVISEADESNNAEVQKDGFGDPQFIEISP